MGRGFSADQKLDFPGLAQELPKIRKDGDSLLMVFWFPVEYFEASVQDNPGMTADQKAAVKKVLSPYTAFAVIDSKVGTFGTFSYKSEAEVRAKVHFVDVKGKSYEPLDEDDINADAKVFLAAFKPVMANAMGPMGKNMHVFFFSAKGDDGKPLFNPKAKGAVTLKLGKEEFRWRLPLGALMPPKACTKCKEKCSGAWDFCPWCGTHLETVSH